MTPTYEQHLAEIRKVHPELPEDKREALAQHRTETHEGHNNVLTVPQVPAAIIDTEAIGRIVKDALDAYKFKPVIVREQQPPQIVRVEVEKPYPVVEYKIHELVRDVVVEKPTLQIERVEVEKQVLVLDPHTTVVDRPVIVEKPAPLDRYRLAFRVIVLALLVGLLARTAHCQDPVQSPKDPVNNLVKGGGGAPTGAAGGGLTGTYPNPTVATGTVTNAMLAGSIAPSKITGTAVIGGSAITTAGCVPFQSGSNGDLTCNSGLTFASSVFSIPVNNDISTNGTGHGFIFGGNTSVGMTGGGSTNYRLTSFGAGTFYQYNGSSYVEVMRLASTTGNLLLGGTTDGNYRFDVQKSGSAGTARFYDQTATTGATSVLIQAGAGDASGAKLLRGVLNDGTTEKWSITRDGAATFAGAGTFTGNVLGATFIQSGAAAYVYSGGFVSAASSGFRWVSTANATDAAIDVGLARNAAGVVEVNSGTANAYRDIKLRNITLDGAKAVTGSRTLCVDTNGLVTAVAGACPAGT